MTHTLYVYLPCYNEAGNIRPLVEQWLAERELLEEEGYSLSIAPIDDKSTDDTLSILHALAAESPLVRPIAHSVNQNLGGVVNTAIDDFLARAQEGDLLALMDGDNTHKPRFIHPMLQKLREEHKGCVIASRYQPGAQVQGLAQNRKLFSGGAKLYYSLMLHVPGVKDYTCGYRVYTRDALRAGRDKYGSKLVERKTFACMMELLYKLYRAGCTFGEVPFTLYYDSKEGESKMRVGKTIKDSFLTAAKLRFSKK